MNPALLIPVISALLSHHQSPTPATHATVVQAAKDASAQPNEVALIQSVLSSPGAAQAIAQLLASWIPAGTLAPQLPAVTPAVVAS